MKTTLLACLLLFGCSPPTIIVVERYALNTCTIGEVFGHATPAEQELALSRCNARGAYARDYTALSLEAQRYATHLHELIFGALEPLCEALTVSQTVPTEDGKYHATVECGPRQ